MFYLQKGTKNPVNLIQDMDLGLLGYVFVLEENAKVVGSNKIELLLL